LSSWKVSGLYGKVSDRLRLDASGQGPPHQAHFPRSARKDGSRYKVTDPAFGLKINIGIRQAATSPDFGFGEEHAEIEASESGLDAITDRLVESQVEIDPVLAHIFRVYADDWQKSIAVAAEHDQHADNLFTLDGRVDDYLIPQIFFNFSEELGLVRKWTGV